MKPRICDRLKQRARRLEFAVLALAVPARDRRALRDLLHDTLPPRRWVIYGKAL